MIPLAEINSMAEKYRVPAETIEKDYIISWILSCLAKSDIKKNFIFYGGTAIKRIYFEDHRFSEDIDLLSGSTFTKDTILQELQTLDYAQDAANIALEIDPNSINANNDRIQLFVKYDGYDEITGAPKMVRLDFTMGMHLYGREETKEVIPSYSDLSNVTASLKVMSLNTILANKLGLLCDATRNEPRDVFDIWFLLKRIGEFNFNVSDVRAAFKDKYGFSLALGTIRPGLRAPWVKKNWEIRLKMQLAEAYDVDEIVREIEEGLTILF